MVPLKKKIDIARAALTANFPNGNYENNQQDALYRFIYYSKLAVHVLGDVFAQRQEHLTVFTASGSVHPSYQIL